MNGAGRLLLVRHARTADNANSRRMGRQDPPLDDVGRAQVVGLTSALESAIPLETQPAIHSSPLIRAIQTIAPFASARSLPVRLEPELMEMDFGIGENGAEPVGKLRVKERYVYDPMPGGESMLQVWQRCVAFFARVSPELASGGAVLVAAHYRVSQLLAGVASGLDFEAAVWETTFKPTNSSVFEMRFTDDGRLAAGPVAVWAPHMPYQGGVS